MKRLIGYTAALCLLALTVGCGGVTSTGTLAYISNSTGTGFTVFKVNTDGTLTKSSISPQNTPASPKVLQFAANGKWAYFLDEGGTGVFGYKRSGSGELNTPVDLNLPYPLSGRGSALVISPSSNFVYVALQDTKRLVTYSIDAATGQLSAVGSPALINYSITQLVMAPGGAVLYGLAPDQQAVLSFTLNSSSGIATLASTLPVGTNPSYIVLSANGSYLYVLDHTATGTNNNIGVDIASPSIFGYNTSGSGVLQQMAGSPFNENPAHTSDDPTGAKIYTAPSNPVSGATSTDTRYLFVANQASHNISSFKINSTTGELSEVTGTEQDVKGVITSTGSPFDCGTGCSTPSFLTVSSANNALYLLDTSANKVFQFKIDQGTGRVRALNPASVSAEGNPTWVTMR
ncbi:MAG TPA: beta-propeller fold lactonase family protein [Candidatus Saccharimonadales bacterium]|nr:beta-propeller fold lactonase family protein [Candidatus Saccharimonadales bacterium]